MSVVEKFFADLGHKLKPGVLVMATLDFGPFAGENVPTVFFLDGELDPAYAQYSDEDGWYVFGLTAQTHVSIPLGIIEKLHYCEDEAALLWDSHCKPSED